MSEFDDPLTLYFIYKSKEEGGIGFLKEDVINYLERRKTRYEEAKKVVRSKIGQITYNKWIDELEDLIKFFSKDVQTWTPLRISDIEKRGINEYVTRKGKERYIANLNTILEREKKEVD